MRTLALLIAFLSSLVLMKAENQTCFKDRFEYEYAFIQRLALIEAKANQQEQFFKRLQEQGSTSFTSYIRWGKSSCPCNASTIYSGYAGGSQYNHAGGGTNYLYLTPDPIFSSQSTGGYRASVYGAEYRTGGTFWDAHNLHDVPCVVCLVQQPHVIMIPGRNACYPDWRREYSGYLMSSHNSHASGKEYICMDGTPETTPGTSRNNEGALFYLAAASCGSLPCPPYSEGYEITCVVCSYNGNDL